MKPLTGRRRFVKGMTALGAGIYMMPALGSLDKARPVTLLLSATVHNPRFIAGLSSISPTQIQSVAPFQMQYLPELVRNQSGQRFIGLMDNASYVVLAAALSDQGARFIVTGHHGQGHYFNTVPETAGVAAVLQQSLAVGEQDCQLMETCLGLARQSSPRLSPAPVFVEGLSDWAAVTGACYAQIANGEWCSGLPGNTNRSNIINAAARDALVSFVVEV